MRFDLNIGWNVIQRKAYNNSIAGHYLQKKLMKYKISGHSSHPGAPSPANAFTSTSPTPFDEVCSLLLLNINCKHSFMWHN